MVTALLILTLVALFLAIHPFITYPLSLALLAKLGVRDKAPIERHLARAGGEADREPARTVTICLSVFNEERVIDQRIANLLEMTPLAWKFKPEQKRLFAASSPTISLNFYLDLYKKVTELP